MRPAAPVPAPTEAAALQHAPERRGRAWSSGRRWLVPAAVAALLAAGWLRATGVPYLLGAAVATALALAAAARADAHAHGAREQESARVGARRGRELPWALAAALAVAAFLVPASLTEIELARLAARPATVRAQRQAAAVARLEAAVGQEVRALRAAARTALDAPLGAAAFDALGPLARQVPERAVVLERAGLVSAWAGTLRVQPQGMRAPVGVAITPFYVVLYATAAREDVRAVATMLLHAEPPAAALASPLDVAAGALDGVRTLEVVAPGDTAAYARAGAGGQWRVLSADGVPIVAVRAAAPERAEAELRVTERGRRFGLAALALVAAIVIGAAWRRPSRLRARLGALGVPLAALAFVPLTSLSNATQLFDPAVYFASVGGPFTATIGALALSSALLVLAVFAVLRSSQRLRSRPVAALLAVALAALSPYVLRALARGIAPPSAGAPVSLWVAWEVALCLAGAAVLLAGVTAGRTALGERRGLPAYVAPSIAGLAAILGPVLWQTPARWPVWYPALWIAAIVALAFTRRRRAPIVAAATVAGLGAATLVWGATVRKRVELATSDVAGLSTPDLAALPLLERFGFALAALPAPPDASMLLRRYASSTLAAADYPVSLAVWEPGADTARARIATSRLALDSAAVRAVVDSARAAGEPLVAQVPGSPGVAQVVAVPHPGGAVTSIALLPRTRLAPDDPIAPLLGVGVTGPSSEPPYSIALVGRAPAPASAAPRWTRDGSELHGDWVVPSRDGPMRVHAEVELRPLDALAQRGALLVLVDLLVVGVLWSLPAIADGAVPRWLRRRRRAWARSYRARLTLALFTFFLLPTASFAVWAYRELRTGDVQARELLLRETLRAAAGELPIDRGSGLRALSAQLATPLLVYERGALVAASDPLFVSLAPVGLFLPPQQMLDIGVGDEVTSSRMMRVGSETALFGFRAAVEPDGYRLVLGAPARADALALDQRRRDLGFLVLLAAAGGALAALWLSGIAARELARPVGALRRAALALARGARAPRLTARPPAEFRPVFAAFRRMARDLADSRRALEVAQRRTAAVLRNVASGVVAVDRASRVVLANPRAAALAGRELRPGDALGDAWPPIVADRVGAFLVADADEEEFDVELRGRQLRARLTRLGHGAAAVLTLDDLTELAHAQRVLAWGEMARQVAHEIKNPLTPIRLGVQHLRRARRDARPDFDEILDRNVERILAEIDRLDEIARAFSRYGTAPDQRAPAERVDVAAIARDVVALERMGQGGGVQWTLTSDAEAVAAMARDAELREVLLNLLENARLAGARAVHVRVARSADRQRVTIAVEDDGEGIPAEVLPRVFEPHFSTRTSGSGLGLAISRRIVDGWGGAIGVTSERSIGTTVTIALLPG